MSNYRRLISYIYAYEGEVKGKNIGFAKLEARNGQCKINVNVKKVYVGGNDLAVYLLATTGEIELGKIFIRNGAGEFRTSVDVNNVEHSGISMDKCYGLTIHDTEGSWQNYTTIWEDAVAHAAEVELAGITSENMRKKEEEKEEKKKREEAARRESKKELQSGQEILAEQGGEHGLEGTEEENAETAAEAKKNSVSIAEKEEDSASFTEKAASPLRFNEAEEHSANITETEEIPVNLSAAEKNQSEVSLSEENQKAEVSREKKEELLSAEETRKKLSPQAIVLEPPRIEQELAKQFHRQAEQKHISAAANMQKEQRKKEIISPLVEAKPKEWIAQLLSNDEVRREKVLEKRMEKSQPWDHQIQSVELSQPVQPAPQGEHGSGRQQSLPDSKTVISAQTQEVPLPDEPDTEPENMEENEGEPDYELLWDRFSRQYPKMTAFDYENGCEILSIKPQDIGLLPRENWVYGNNSFLLHGYYSYRYLILVRLHNPSGKPRFLLGVPGHYFSNEKHMATMFGFPHFVLSKKQPVEQGRFGYWYTDVKMGNH